MSKLTIADTLAALGRKHETYLRFLERSDFDVGMYKPEQIDNQTPHMRDELYVIAQGTGEFCLREEIVSFEPGDVLFAPSGVEHRFMNFSSDFATWVVFIGKRE